MRSRPFHSGRATIHLALLLAAGAAAGNLPLSFEPNGVKGSPFLARGEDFTAYFGISRVTVSLPRGAYAMLFRGSNPSLWLVTEESPMSDMDRSQLRYSSLYHGIDLVFHGYDDLLEYDFIVHPRSDPSVIELEFEGVTLVVESDGSISLIRRGERLYRHRPYFYQEKAGGRQEVWGRYIRSGPSRVRFTVGKYDRAVPLVIN